MQGVNKKCIVRITYEFLGGCIDSYVVMYLLEICVRAVAVSRDTDGPYHSGVLGSATSSRQRKNKLQNHNARLVVSKANLQRSTGKATDDVIASDDAGFRHTQPTLHIYFGAY
jgi:hypothetical protein